MKVQNDQSASASIIRQRPNFAIAYCSASADCEKCSFGHCLIVECLDLLSGLFNVFCSRETETCWDSVSWILCSIFVRHLSNLFPSSSFMHVDITDNGVIFLRWHSLKLGSLWRLFTLIISQSEWPKDKPFLLRHSRHARNFHDPKIKRIFEIAWTVFEIIQFIHFYPLK